MLMIYNNLFEANLTIKVAKPSQSIAFQFGVNPIMLQFSSSFDQLPYFHYKFVMLANCSKFEYSWLGGFVILGFKDE
jgi:hypothetical protein